MPGLEGRRSQGGLRRRSSIRVPTSNVHSLIIYVDGASRGNPGPAGVGVLLQGTDGVFRRELFEYIGEATNNVAEYRALLLALRKARALGVKAVTVFSDSELLVKQLKGEYRVRDPKLLALRQKVLTYLSSIPSFRIEHVTRELNQKADELANRAIDQALKKGGPWRSR